MIKTSTALGAANAVATLTVTSPNTKQIVIHGWEISMIGSAALTADVTFTLKDEDGNTLWTTSLQRAVANANANVMPYAFAPKKPIFIPVGKNAVLSTTAGGANTQIRISAQYSI